jgi:hypothetical protein
MVVWLLGPRSLILNTSALSKLEDSGCGSNSTLAPQICEYTMRMVMDRSTRMTDVKNRWAFSSVTPSALRQDHNLYNPALSNTAQELNGYTWGITYSDGGAASGNLVYTDTVDISGFTVPGQAVELPRQVSNDFVQWSSLPEQYQAQGKSLYGP